MKLRSKFKKNTQQSLTAIKSRNPLITSTGRSVASTNDEEHPGTTRPLTETYVKAEADAKHRSECCRRELHDQLQQ
jgi:hypothetical protein